MNWGMTMRNALFGFAICTVLIAALPVIYALSPALSLVAVLIVPAFFSLSIRCWISHSCAIFNWHQASSFSWSNERTYASAGRNVHCSVWHRAACDFLALAQKHGTGRMVARPRRAAGRLVRSKMD